MEAVVREVYEETGYLLSVDRLVLIQERFYSVSHVHHHEVVFFYLMDSTDVPIEDGTSTDQQNEKLYWLPIDRLQNIHLVPAFLQTALTNIPKDVMHIISKES